MKKTKLFFTAIILVSLVTSSCSNSKRTQQLLGKWQLTQTLYSIDGGKHYEALPIGESEELIFLEDGIALYTNQVLYNSLDSATWRLYSLGDSLEVLDEQRRITGMYDKFRILQLFTEHTPTGEEYLIMDLQQSEIHNDLVSGEETIITKKRYQKVKPYRITVTDTESSLLDGKPTIYKKFAGSNRLVGFYKSSKMERRYATRPNLPASPVVAETPQAYGLKINGKTEWFYRSELTDVSIKEITTDMYNDLFHGRSVTLFDNGNLDGLVLGYFLDNQDNGWVEVFLIRYGVAILPAKYRLAAIPLKEKGFCVEPNWKNEDLPSVYYGTDYQEKDETGDNYLNLSKLNKNQVMAIWRAAQGDTPNKVYVLYLTSDEIGHHLIEEYIENN